MHPFLLVFEFLGTTELLVIAVVALVLFGPRKLPEIGRTVGKAIGEFKRASAVQGGTYGGDAPSALPPYDAAAGDFDGSHSQAPTPEPTVARGAAEDDE